MTMKRSIIFSIILLLAASCNKSDNPWGTYGYEGKDQGSKQKVVLDYPNRKAIPEICDMVLFYGGGNHRNPFKWDAEHIRPYISYKDKLLKTHWLFDGFLCIEFKMPQFKHSLISGYADSSGKPMDSAVKSDWQALVNYYFEPNSGIDLIEQCVAEVAATLGNPPTKRKVVVGIPEPIKTANYADPYAKPNYWGEIDGQIMSFNNEEDRIKAVKWYIDEVRKQFLAKKYKYVELAGFYWVSETSSNTANILAEVSKYLHKQKYSFNWIPYFNSKGFDKWKEFGFDYSYLQPNYAFHDELTTERLDAASILAQREEYIGMEVEFDEDVIYTGSKKGKMAPRLYDYLDSFKKYGWWENGYLAYYQGSWAIRGLSKSTDSRDQDTYNHLCEWIVTRPMRSKIK